MRFGANVVEFGKLAAGLSLALGGMSLAAAPAVATVLDYSLNDYVGTGSTNLVSSPYGTVALDDNGGSNVTVTVTLASGVGFVNTGAGYPLTWDLSGAPDIPVANITSGFSFDYSSTGSLHTGGAGYWDYAIACSVATCGHGGQSPYTGTLSFTIDNVTLADFVANSDSNHFSADVCLGVSGGTCSGGITGVVVANLSSTSFTTSNTNVPEPASVTILGAALGTIAFFRRRLRRA